MTKKICYKCKEEKELTEFYKDKSRKDNLGNRCKACNKIDYLAHQKTAEGKKAQKYRAVKWKYGLTKQEYDTIVATHKNCQICGTSIVFGHGGGSRGGDAACIDHDHTTGKLRGVLCNHCNRALGLFGDNIETLLQAAEYLKAHSAYSE